LVFFFWEIFGKNTTKLETSSNRFFEKIIGLSFIGYES